MDDYVHSARQRWVQRLIDVSRRNNLLYFRPLRSGTLDLSGAETRAFAALLHGQPVNLTHLAPAADLEELTRRARAIEHRALANQEEKGITTLFLGLGLATWAPDDSGRLPAAVVLLAPVAFAPARMSAGQSLTIRCSGAVQPNPVLLSVLASRFGLNLVPADLLGDLADDEELPDLEAVLERLRTAAADVPGFEVSPRALLGNFSFQKMAMVQDLEIHAPELRSHPLIAALAGDPVEAAVLRARQSAAPTLALDTVAPDDEFLFLDADASQQRTIALVQQGYSGVIQGPPGTGKSQTIANLIATLAASGKRVLFVAEKRAALEVVLRRLETAGLGRLALDLHGADISRRAVVQRFTENLAQVRETAAADSRAIHQQFADRRGRLNLHAARLHLPRPPSMLSVYDLIGRVLRMPLAERPATRWRDQALLFVTPDAIARVRDLLTEAGAFRTLFLRDDGSPWTFAALTDGAAARRAHELAVQVAAERLPALRAAAADLAAALGIVPPATVDACWALDGLLGELDGTLNRYRAALFRHDLAALVQQLEPARPGGLRGAWHWITNGTLRAGESLARSLRHAGFAWGDALLLELTAAADQQARWHAWPSADAAATGGVRTADPAAHAAPPRIDAALRPVPDDLETIIQAHQAFPQALQSLSENLAELAPLLNHGALSTLGFDDLAALVAALAADATTPLRLPRLRAIEQELAALGVGALLDELRATRPTTELWPELCEHAWLLSCLDQAFAETPELGGFDVATHERFVREFCALDARRLTIAAQRVRRAHAERIIEALNAHPQQAQLVRRELEKRRRQLPLRRMLAEAPDVLLALCPCWMASPLSVSQLLDARRRYFDVVIFDEASQVLPEDAVSSILRGDQLVVAGDRYQLPPTTFFSDAGEPDAPDDAPTEGFESLLDVLGTLFDPWSLEWHYRSRDEALIAFSNRHIYANRLLTFPGPGGPPVLTHELVIPPGYDPGQEESVAAEVERVTALVLAHAQQRPDETLGVIAMGIRHAERIELALERALQQHPELEAFFDQQRAERFFVKNLERVQGDERDAIILTIGYGKDRNGRLPYRFGPLLLEGGERRLNVAVTRARRRMTLVSSFRYNDMEPGRSNARGVELLRLYLRYAETGGTALESPDSAGVGTEALDLFSQDFAETLRACGIDLQVRHGSSRGRIEYVVRHPTHPERLVLALESDGAAYASIPTARDRDRLRQQHLEALGWRYQRVWALAWLLQREQEVQRILAACAHAVQRTDANAQQTRELAAEIAEQSVRTVKLTPAVRGARPHVPLRNAIESYRPEEIQALVRWILSDGRLRTDEEILDEMVQELGFKRRGTRIEAVVRTAIAAVRS